MTLRVSKAEIPSELRERMITPQSSKSAGLPVQALVAVQIEKRKLLGDEVHHIIGTALA